MAIVAMKQIRLLALLRDRKAILDLLQRLSVVDVSDGNEEDSVFRKADTSAVRNELLKSIETAETAVTLLDKHAGCKGPSLAFLRGREAKNVEENENILKQCDENLGIARRIVQLDQEIKDTGTAIARLQTELAALEPWLGLPVPQTFSGTKRTAVFIGVLEGEHHPDGIQKRMTAAAPGLDSLHVQVVSGGKSQTCVMAIVPRRLGAEAEEALKSIGFARAPGANGDMPAAQKAWAEAEIEKNTRAAEAASGELAGYADRRTALCYLQDSLKIQADQHEITGRLGQSAHVFALSGYIREKDAPLLECALTQSFTCVVEISHAERPGEEVPVLLENSRFAEPTESIVESYSLPGKTDIDPTGVMSIFYYLMFGLMFGDAGYGLIMAGVCGFCLLRFKNMEPNWSKNIRLFFWCGIATIFWGVVFSSYFGNAVDVIGATFFGTEISIPPVWFSIEQKPMLMLVFCMGLGIVHLTVGFIMKGVADVKNGDKAGILGDVVFPVLLWYSLMALLANSDMFFNLANIRLPLSATGAQVCLCLAGAAGIGIIFTGGRGTKNWALRILLGLYATYNALSGWLSDMLSYSRLLALGLASGVIASVMNQLGSMGGKGIGGILLFAVVFVLGHAMNFGINVLGAYVHSNRLEYIEFFGKFYEGGGRKFSPFGIRTKHYKITKEDY